MKTLKVEELLQRDVYDVSGEPHITIDPSKCEECDPKPCIRLCPAECYTLVGNKVLFSYEGCLECGTCRIVCPEDAITWDYPKSGRGIQYRFA